VGDALVVDVSKYLREVVGFNKDRAEVTVQPGVVLDQLNAWLRPHGLWYPVDVSTSAQCTLGGMAGNNSCGSRSIRYGNMVHNVASIDAILASGERARFGSARPEDMPPAVRTIADKGPRWPSPSATRSSPVAQGAAPSRWLQPSTSSSRSQSGPTRSTIR